MNFNKKKIYECFFCNFQSNNKTDWKRHIKTNKHRKNSIKWSKVSDQAYWNARLLPFPYGPKINQ